MSDSSEANELRLVANEIMYQLYLLGEKGQLEILKNYAQSAIDNINKGK